MNTLISLTAMLSDSRLLAVFDLWLKAAILFALAGIAVAALSYWRASAATRHFVWLLAIVGSLIILPLSSILPAWKIELSANAGPSPSTADLTTPPLILAEIQASSVDAPVSAQPRQAPTEATAPLREPAVQTIHASSQDIQSRGTDWPTVALSILAVGAVVCLLPVCLGALSLRRLSRACKNVTDDRRLSILNELRQQLSISRRVALVTCSERSIPMTWGLANPVILLPANSTNWNTQRLRAVLMHELAHVQRFDCLTQIVGQLARALHWSNPLAWLAVRGLRREQEQACDDRVLHSGLPPTDYAAHLLAVASQKHRLFAPAIGLAMARNSRIERRLASILDARSNRRSLSRAQASLVAAGLLALVIPLASLTTQIKESHAAEQAATKDDVKNDEKQIDAASSDRLARLRQVIVEQYVTPPNEDQVLRGAIRGMVESLNDPYSEFLPKEKLADFESQVAGKLTGIGAQLEMRNDQLTVVTPLEGSPALKSAVKAGDAILEINGKTTRDIKLPDAVKQIVGEAGTEVKLKLRRASGDTADVTVTRGPLTLRSVRGFARGKDHAWQWLISRDHKLGYIAVDHLAPTTPNELRDAINALKQDGLNGLILDLRFSPGGLLQSAHETAQLFLDEATVVTIRGRDGKEQSFMSDGKQRLGDFPLVVLVNEQTASAAEILAGALKDNGRAILLGTRTHGKGSVQTIVKLDDGDGAVRLTTAFFHLPRGSNIDRRPGDKSWGVDPSDGYFLPMTADENEQLKKHRRDRDIIGDPAPADAQNANLTPDLIAKDHADAQLAAALRTLTAKVTTGEFEKVGKSAAEAEQYAQRRGEVERRREGLLKNIQELDRELKSLEASAK